MGFTEIFLIMTIALILFGPEELPGIARRVAKVIMEVRKFSNESTKELQKSVASPVNIFTKAFEHSVAPSVAEKVSYDLQEKLVPNEKLLSHDDESTISDQLPTSLVQDYIKD